MAQQQLKIQSKCFLLLQLDPSILLFPGYGFITVTHLFVLRSHRRPEPTANQINAESYI